MSISVSNLSKWYGQQRAIDQISFEIPKGQIVGFLGPNGAGKSTTMKILTGYIPASEGKAAVCGLDIEQDLFAVKQQIGYLPESNPLYKDMYIREFLTYVAKIYKLKDVNSKVNEMIKMTGLHVEEYKKIHQLSKGYKQRVGLAQALIHSPEVLILDEPTSGLDPNQLVEIRNLILEIGKEKTVLLSTHIMQEVEAMCKRVIIINKGQIVADQETSELKNRQGQSVVIHIELKQQVTVNEMQAIYGITQVEQNGNTWKLHTTQSGEKVRQAVFDYCVQKGYTILSLSQEERNLESVFKELTQNETKA